MSYNEITLDQLIDAEGQEGNKSLYGDHCPSSFAASKMTATNRGTRIENVVFQHIKDMGYEATQTVHTGEWDITVELTDRPVRVEVKSACVSNSNKTNKRFFFMGICPESFEYIVFAFVHPTEGIILKWTTSERFWDQWACKRKESRKGYNLPIPLDLVHKYVELFDMEDFPDEL
jgi:hypothetical protein